MALACNCVGIAPHLAIPPRNVLESLTVPQIRAYATAHKIGPTGTSEHGASIWRATASKAVLIDTLLIHTGLSVPAPLAAAPHPGVEQAIKDLVSGLQPNINMEALKAELRAYCTAEVEKIRSSVEPIHIEHPSGAITDCGRQHHNFPALVKLISIRENTLLVGPAGSGKTSAAVAACKGLGFEHEVVSVGPQTMQSELAGYRNANGTYIESAVRRCFEGGRKLILDEMDAGNPGVFTYLNAIIENMMAGFPDGTVERNANFSIVACANTWGSGADMQYVGRSQLDAATLDRFTTLEWNYDEAFEMDLALAINPDAKPWVLKVQKWRKNMFNHKVRHVISPRASLKGAKLLRAGFTEAQIEKMVVFKGLNKEAFDKITQGV